MTDERLNLEDVVGATVARNALRSWGSLSRRRLKGEAPRMRYRAFLVLVTLCLLPAPLWPEPGTWSPVCRQGETFVRVITWQDSAGALVNLAGYTAKLQLRDPRTAALVDEWTDANGLVLGGATGTITWTITALETALLPVGALVYDLRLTSGTSVVTYLLYGYVTVRKRITE